jgi:hypothetical protein
MTEHDATEAAYRNGYAAGLAVQREQSGGWISVKDALPENEVGVLITGVNNFDGGLLKQA